jgi:hypothetical protein
MSTLSAYELVGELVYHRRCTILTYPVVEKSRDHKSKGVGSILLPQLYAVKEDGDPSLKLWAQTLLVEDRGEHRPVDKQASRKGMSLCRSRAADPVHVAGLTRT